MDTKIAYKAVRAARLAAAMAILGRMPSDAQLHADESARHDDAAVNQGYIAGELAAKAGMTTEQLAKEVPQLMLAAAYPAWNGIVDGWYEAQPKDVTEAEVSDALAVLARIPSDAQLHDVMTRMWSELQRRRGL